MTENIQTETDISTDGRTERQADRRTEKDRQIDRGCLWFGETVTAEQGCRRGGGVQGLTGQIREQE